MKFNKFISELNRRHVFKATIAYLAISWVVIQIASIILPAFNAPTYALKGIIYLLAIGLVFWIPFSWIYDLTPGGIQKTDISPFFILPSRDTEKPEHLHWNTVLGFAASSLNCDFMTH